MARATGAMSPLSKLLWALLLFSCNVLAASAVLGIDLGTEYIKASLVKPGIPLDIVLTKDSRRKEASAVAFKPLQNGPKAKTYPERLYGSDAMALSARFPGDVYPNLKVLLGLPTDVTIVTEYAQRHPALQLSAHKGRGTSAFKSAGAFTPDEEPFMVEELVAMELQSIQKNAEAMAGPGSSVRSAVITVPPFFTFEERRAVELAADLAGLRILSLISDGLAVGLNYATSRTFPNINEGAKPEYHMVFDMGAGSTKATVMRFQSRTVKDVGKYNKTVQEIQVVGTGWDRTLGGDALNYLIVDDMAAKFAEAKAAPKGILSHGRAVAKMTKEAERVRQVLSANQETGSGFEALYEDRDFKYKLSRADFEKMAGSHAERVATAVKMALRNAKLEIADLDSVILHGGATRTPFVQKELEKLFTAEKIRTNVNTDEAAVFGAGFRAAELSPSFRVKEIRVSDGASHAAGIKYTGAAGKLLTQRLWSAASLTGGPAMEMTFTTTDDLDIDLYQQVAPLPPATASTLNSVTKSLKTKNLTATVAHLKEKFSCEHSDVQFKLHLKLSAENGEMEVAKAFLQCEGEVQEKAGVMDGVKNLFGFGKKDDQKPLKDGESNDSASSATEESSSTTDSSSSSATTSTDAAAASESTTTTKKMVTVPVDYELVKAGIPQLPKADLTKLKDRIKAFDASDKARFAREEALNQLEAFTYKVGDLLDNEAFVAASTGKERESLAEKSSAASEWLYGDGADASKEELKKRLKELKKIVDPIQNRIDEAAKRPELVTGLKDALKQTTEFVGSIKKNIAEYEDFQSSSSADSSSVTESSASTTTTPAPAKDDFADLEDDDASTTTKSSGVPEDVLKDRGPVPPLYTAEDLAELEALQVKIVAWLDDKEAAQGKLGVTDNPVLTVKELTSWREKLDKAGLDLTMKGVRNFEKKNKKPATPKSKSKPKKKGDKKDEPVKVKFGGDDGKVLSDEELEELLRQYQQQNPPSGEGAKVEHDEL